MILYIGKEIITNLNRYIQSFRTNTVINNLKNLSERLEKIEGVDYKTWNVLTESHPDYGTKKTGKIGIKILSSTDVIDNTSFIDPNSGQSTLEFPNQDDLSSLSDL